MKKIVTVINEFEVETQLSTKELNQIKGIFNDTIDPNFINQTLKQHKSELTGSSAKIQIKDAD